MISRRPFLLSLVALPIAACSRSDGAGAGAKRLTSVKLQLDWVPEPEFGGFYAAHQGGDFTREGLDVAISGGGSGVPVVQMVASGKAELGVTGGDAVLLARSRGADVVPIFAVYQRSPQAIMAHASRGAKTLGEVLSSGTLAVEPGLSYVLFLKKKYGFDKVSVVPYDGGVARFLAGKDFAQQCFVTSEPIAAQAKGGDPQVFLVADEGFNPYLGVVFTRAELVAQKPELIKAFVRASRAGWRRYLDDPGPANAVMGKINPAMNAETFAAAAAKQRPLIEEGGKLGAMTRDRWELLGKQLTELGVIDKPNVPELLGD